MVHLMASHNVKNDERRKMAGVLEIGVIFFRFHYFSCLSRNIPQYDLSFPPDEKKTALEIEDIRGFLRDPALTSLIRPRRLARDTARVGTAFEMSSTVPVHLAARDTATINPDRFLRSWTRARLCDVHLLQKPTRPLTQIHIILEKKTDNVNY